MAPSPYLALEEAQRGLAALLSSPDHTEANAAPSGAKGLLAHLVDSISAWKEIYHDQIQAVEEQHETFRTVANTARDAIEDPRGACGDVT
jgi:hypothetical protein